MMGLVMNEKMNAGIQDFRRRLLPWPGLQTFYGWTADCVVQLVASISRMWESVRRNITAPFLRCFSIIYGFRYRERLDTTHFRLVRIPTATDGWAARFEVESFPLDECPPYIAMSYTWGPPQSGGPPSYNWRDKLILFLNNRIFLVFPNLCHALSQLSQSRPGGYVWIDAICINQNDNTEKAAQLSVMDLIYTRADETIIWLGPETERATRALRTLSVIAADAKARTLTWAEQQTFGDAFYVDDLDLLEKNGVPRLEPDDWRDLADIFTRRWFGRVWMIQELSLSGRVNVLVGPREIPWETIGHAALFLTMANVALGLMAGKHMVETRILSLGILLAFGLQMTRERCLGADSEFKALFENSNFGLGITEPFPASILLHLLASSAGFGATIHLDRVYALLSIANHVSRVYGLPTFEIQEEYKSYLQASDSLALRLFGRGHMLAHENALRKIAISLYRQSNSLNVLSLAGDASRKGNLKFRLPSWMPSFEDGHPYLLGPTFLSIKPFDSSKHSFPVGGHDLEAMIDEDKGILRLKALDLGAIEEFGESWLEIANGELEKCCRLLLHCGPTYAHTGQPIVDVFWRTLIMDQDLTTRPAPRERLAKSFSDWVMVMTAMKVKKIADLKPHTLELYDGAESRWLVANIDSTNAIPTFEAVGKMLWDLGYGTAADGTAQRVRGPDELSKKTWEEIGELVKSGIQFECLMQMGIAGTRRFFRTTSGRLGLAPAPTQAGDRLVIVWGCSAPLILRKVKEAGPECYRLLGDAYVHGGMFGEMIPEKPDWRKISLL